MPSRKIIFILILCFGIVTSVYLLARNSNGVLNLTQRTSGLSSNPYINLEKTSNDDWKKILVNTDTSKNTAIVLTSNDPSTFDETTLTSQLARDFLSQYLIATKNGPITAEESAKIVNGIVNIPNYTIISGAKYIAENLHINTKSDSYSLQIYENAFNLTLKKNSSQLKEDPSLIFLEALKSASENKLKKLDPIILLNKGFLTDLLNMEVPQKAVQVHLAVLNASSNILSDLEAMRVVFIDPIRGVAVLSKYRPHMIDLKTALETINVFFSQN